MNYPVFHTLYASIGIGICWDQWFPETGRLLGLHGAEVILFPTAIDKCYYGPEESKEWTWQRMRDEWVLVNRAQASMNQVYVGAPNRVGKEKEMEFFGNSIICNPMGEIMSEANAEEKILTAQLNASLIKETRKKWPLYRDRRPTTYHDLIM
jgi:N-carbamoylputrescine amidase